MQKPGYVILLTRNYLPRDSDRRTLRTSSSSAKFFFGNSRGHWEGDTLVVEVTGLNGETWLDSAGNFYAPNTRMVERWTMVEANTIDYEITIEDPTLYTRPWKMTYPKRRAGTSGGESSQHERGRRCRGHARRRSVREGVLGTDVHRGQPR